MFEAIGHMVVKLHRRSIGGLDLADLPESEWRYLTASDLDHVFNGGEVGPESSEESVKDSDSGSNSKAAASPTRRLTRRRHARSVSSRTLSSRAARVQRPPPGLGVEDFDDEIDSAFEDHDLDAGEPLLAEGEDDDFAEATAGTSAAGLSDGESDTYSLHQSADLKETTDAWEEKKDEEMQPAKQYRTTQQLRRRREAMKSSQ